jgi:hypothetical protein
MKNNKEEEITIEEIEEKINQYKNDLSQVESIVEREKNNNTNTETNKLGDLIKLRKDLIEAIEFQEDILKFKKQTDPNTFNDKPITKENIGRICSGFYETENKWYTAMINEVNIDEKTVEITWLGFKEKEVLPFKYIKVQETLKSNELYPGMVCEAIYLDDGKYYPATIDKISEHGVHIKFNRYNEVEVVSFDSIRITPEQKILNIKTKQDKQKNKKEEESLEFKLPDYLKITPADNETQRLSKRKRVKSMKNNHKQKVIEVITKEKQDNWLNFLQKNPKNKKESSHTKTK